LFSPGEHLALVVQAAPEAMAAPAVREGLNNFHGAVETDLRVPLGYRVRMVLLGHLQQRN